MFEEDEQNKASTSPNEEPPVQNERRSTRIRTESTRLIGYERFLDQAIDADGDLIEEAMMMAEAELIDLSEALSNSNWCEVMKEEHRAIEKNNTWELVERTNKKPIDVKWVYKVK